MPPAPQGRNSNRESGRRPGDWNDDRRLGNPPGNDFVAPRNPPPAQTPRRPNQISGNSAVSRVNPISIRSCIGRFTYVWLRNRQEFWFFPIQVWGDTVVGFRWDRRFGWTYTGISLRQIDMFACNM